MPPKRKRKSKDSADSKKPDPIVVKKTGASGPKPKTKRRRKSSTGKENKLSSKKSEKGTKKRKYRKKASAVDAPNLKESNPGESSISLKPKIEESLEEAKLRKSQFGDAKFMVREHVWCYDRDASPPLLYEAVVRTMQRGPRPCYPTSTLVKDDGEAWCWWYYIHFQGWNKKWDKWVVELDLLEDTDDHRLLAKERLKAARARKKSKIKKIDDKSWIEKKQEEAEAKKTAAVEVAAAEKVKSLKRKQTEGEAEFAAGASKDDDAEQAAKKRAMYLLDNDLEESRPEIQEISIPQELKRVLVIEHGRVTMKGSDPAGRPRRMVADLPSPVPVTEVLKMYKASKSTSKDSSWNGMVEKLLSFFDAVLPVLCLYRQERWQCKSLKDNEKFKSLKYSEIYGCEFLLRMITRLPCLIVDFRSPMPKAEKKNFVLKISDLVRYLKKNQKEFFRQIYRRPFENELSEDELKILKKINSGKVRRKE